MKITIIFCINPLASLIRNEKQAFFTYYIYNNSITQFSTHSILIRQKFCMKNSAIFRFCKVIPKICLVTTDIHFSKVFNTCSHLTLHTKECVIYFLSTCSRREVVLGTQSLQVNSAVTYYEQGFIKVISNYWRCHYHY